MVTLKLATPGGQRRPGLRIVEGALALDLDAEVAQYHPRAAIKPISARNGDGRVGSKARMSWRVALVSAT